MNDTVKLTGSRVVSIQKLLYINMNDTVKLTGSTGSCIKRKKIGSESQKWKNM